MTKTYLVSGLACILLVVAWEGRGEPAWPATDGDWTVVNVGGSPYVDVQCAEAIEEVWSSCDPDPIDLVGGTDLNNSFYPTLYWALEGGDLMFRMRVDNDPTQAGGLFVYSVLFNTDGDDGVDYLLQLDNSFHDDVEIVVTDPPEVGPLSSPAWGGLGTLANTAANQVDVGISTEFSRFVNATQADGSQFHQLSTMDDDYFVDIGIPYSMFLAQTGLSEGDSFQFVVGTSSNHENMNKDKPDYQTWADPVPEPGTAGLLVFAAAVLTLRRRRRAIAW